MLSSANTILGGDVTASLAAARARRFIPFKKFDDDEQIVFGEVYAPVALPDTQGDFMRAPAIKDMAYEFMRKGDMYALDTQHSRTKNGSYIVECFIARPGDPDFIEGSWVLGVKVPDEKVWAMVKSQEINGFSVDGSAISTDTTVVVELPEIMHGETDEVGGEKHLFYVKFDAEGKVVGGETSPGADGHVHLIKRGVVTEIAGGHAHRFSYVEGVLAVA